MPPPSLPRSLRRFLRPGADTKEKQAALYKDNQEGAFYSGKVASGQFFAANFLSTVKARGEAIKLRDRTPMEVAEESFAY